MIRDPGRHSFTVAAVFWALAVGMAAGAGAVGKGLVDRELVDSIQRQLAGLEMRLEQSRMERRWMEEKAMAYERLLQAVLPDLWRSWVPQGWALRLQATPGARQVSSRLAAALRQAGVTVQEGSSIAPAEWPWPVPGVILQSEAGRVMGLVGRLPPPPTGTGGETAAPSARSPGSGTYVEGIDSALGQLAAMVALVRCHGAAVEPREALDRVEGALWYAGALQRRGACLEGGPDHRRDGAQPPPHPVGP